MWRILLLLLFCACLFASPAAAFSPLTKPSNDASLRPPALKNQHFEGFRAGRPQKPIRLNRPPQPRQ